MDRKNLNLKNINIPESLREAITQRLGNIDFPEYLRVVIKHRWTILTIFAVIMVSVTIFTFTATPIYKGTVRLIIEKDNPKVLSFEEVMSVDATGIDYYQTQYKIIESRTVAREVIKRLQLDKDKDFNPSSWVGDFIAYIGSFFNTEDPNEIQQKEESKDDSGLVSRFIGGIEVSPIRNSRLVDVSYESTSPALAARIANTLAKAYIDTSLETRLKATKDAIVFLNNEIEQGKKKVDEAEQKLLQYKEQQGIITDFSSDVENITAQKLSALNAQVVEAEMRRAEAETRYRRAAELEKNPDMADSISEIINNALIQQIKDMEVKNQNRMSELSNKYGKKHPQIVALQNEQDSLRTQRMNEIKRVIKSLQHEYQVASAREQTLKGALSRQKNESLNMNEKAIQYNVLKRESDSTKEMYDLLFKRLRETALTEDIRTGNIRIIDPAEVPVSPVKPKKARDMSLGFLLGIALGLGTAFFLERLDNTVKVPSDIKNHLRIPYLGPVPDFSDTTDSSSTAEGEPHPAIDLITASNPSSTVSESYRGIRTNILFSSADRAPQVLLVSSAAPSEGKTATVANLASVVAQMGSKVLVVDCDMRKPKLNKIFQVTRDKGISNVLVGESELADAIMPTKIPNLDILSSGPLPPNPSEIIGSNKMADVLKELRQIYDMIIIDSPPLTAVTDASILSKYSDGIILVIRAGETHMEVVKSGLENLKAVNAKVLGAILNCVSTGRDSYYYYQYHYYYYGEDGEKRKRTGRRRKSSGNA